MMPNYLFVEACRTRSSRPQNIAFTNVSSSFVRNWKKISGVFKEVISDNVNCKTKDGMVVNESKSSETKLRLLLFDMQYYIYL